MPLSLLFELSPHDARRLCGPKAVRALVYGAVALGDRGLADALHANGGYGLGIRKPDHYPGENSGVRPPVEGSLRGAPNSAPRPGGLAAGGGPLFVAGGVHHE